MTNESPLWAERTANGASPDFAADHYRALKRHPQREFTHGTARHYDAPTRRRYFDPAWQAWAACCKEMPSLDIRMPEITLSVTHADGSHRSGAYLTFQHIWPKPETAEDLGRIRAVFERLAKANGISPLEIDSLYGESNHGDGISYITFHFPSIESMERVLKLAIQSAPSLQPSVAAAL